MNSEPVTPQHSKEWQDYVAKPAYKLMHALVVSLVGYSERLKQFSDRAALSPSFREGLREKCPDLEMAAFFDRHLELLERIGANLEVAVAQISASRPQENADAYLEDLFLGHNEANLAAQAVLLDRGAEGVDVCIAMLRDADADRRGAAARWLGQTNDPRAVKPLLNAYDDPTRDVAIEVYVALRRFSDPEAKAFIKEINDQGDVY